MYMKLPVSVFLPVSVSLLVSVTLLVIETAAAAVFVCVIGRY